jgi:branched-chain amino acid transport system ATP-binding protein
MLSVDGLHVSIESVQVLRGLSLTVAEGTMVGLVGRNGAGKTTLMRSVMGHLPVAQGSVAFDGRDLATRAAPGPRAPRHRLHAGGPRPGAEPQRRREHPDPIWASRTLQAAERLDFVYGVLPELKAMRERRALLLSGGQQKMVALARALAIGTRPAAARRAVRRARARPCRAASPSDRRLRGGRLSVLIAQSDLNHSRSLVDVEVVIERGATSRRQTATALERRLRRRCPGRRARCDGLPRPVARRVVGCRERLMLMDTLDARKRCRRSDARRWAGQS